MTRLRLLAFCCSLCAAAGAINLPKHSTPPPAWLLKVQNDPKQPHSAQAVKITAEVTSAVTNLTLEYQSVDPGAYIELKDSAYARNWVSIPMRPEAMDQGHRRFLTELPSSLQKHRHLVRYRFEGQTADGHRAFAPSREDVAPNYAYFVYDGIPPWSAAIDPHSSDPQLAAPLTFSPEALSRVQVYQLLGKKSSIENATWNEQSLGKEYKYTGTLVVDGEVFDHIFYRARGGIWRYAMGKNMWKFYLPGDHQLQARDDFGRPYPVTWNKVNLRAVIQQGDYGCRGEQGMFETVGFRLFSLVGVPAPFTHWIQLRIIDQPKENPSDQYRGDFWGLYLAIENEDGRFLKAHDLPSGNLYKMEGGGGTLQHHGTGAVTNSSDLYEFMGAFNGPNLQQTWWRTNFDLPGYYSYRAIAECIHHYDVGDGKNYDFYHNPKTGQWQMIPWDIDLTWADTMYGHGDDPIIRRVLSRPAFRLEYQNRLREIRDLLFNQEQTGKLIDECASVIWDRAGATSIVEADRRKWDYHPVMARGWKSGQGKFYEAAPTRDFRGMLLFMKEYVKSRSAWIDAALLNDRAIPATSAASYAGPASFPSNQLRFRVSSYKGEHNFSAMKWRLAEVSDNKSAAGPPREPRHYEITPGWESAELTNPAEDIKVPDGLAQAGHTYRVRVRMKDVTGRWSHWSAPVEFVAGKS